MFHISFDVNVFRSSFCNKFSCTLTNFTNLIILNLIDICSTLKSTVKNAQPDGPKDPWPEVEHRSARLLEKLAMLDSDYYDFGHTPRWSPKH